MKDEKREGKHFSLLLLQLQELPGGHNKDHRDGRLSAASFVMWNSVMFAFFCQ